MRWMVELGVMQYPLQQILCNSKPRSNNSTGTIPHKIIIHRRIIFFNNSNRRLYTKSRQTQPCCIINNKMCNSHQVNRVVDQPHYRTWSDIHLYQGCIIKQIQNKFNLHRPQRNSVPLIPGLRTSIQDMSPKQCHKSYPT